MSFISKHKWQGQHKSRQFWYIYNSKCEKLVWVNFDHKLTFDDLTSELCKTGRWKIHALARVTPYMNISKRRIFMNVLFTSQFSHWTLIWICFSCTNNKKKPDYMNIAFEVLRSSVEEPLEKDNPFSIHPRNI